MSQECTSSSCCETKPQSSACKTEECCPVDMAVECWGGAAKQAMREVQVDILKKKMQAAWGPMMEKVADAVLENMGVEWQSMIAKGKSNMVLREKIVKAWDCK